MTRFVDCLEVECLIQWKDDEDNEFALSFLTLGHRDTIKYLCLKCVICRDAIDEICITGGLSKCLRF